jgi:hypothetical protein
MVALVRSVAVLLLAATTFAAAQEGKYSIKPGDAAPPKELSEQVRKLLDGKPVQFLDAQGKTVADLWRRKEVPADVTPEQIKNGLTYRELSQTEILGAVKFHQDWTDYRKQKVKAGVYTLRLGFQPADGDHAGSSTYQEFLVAIDAAKDTKPAVMEPEQMVKMSMKTVNTGHPGVFMLFPNPKPAAEPKLEAKPNNHWVLFAKEDVSVKGKKTEKGIGLGITLVGHAE